MTEANRAAIKVLYEAARAANKNWSKELRRLFGKDASFVRYTPRGEGEEGSELNRAYLIYRHATQAWRLAIRCAANEYLNQNASVKGEPDEQS